MAAAYGEILLATCVTLIYGSAMPLLYWVAAVGFGVERGGMRSAPLPDGEASSSASESLIVQPWWCVCRQMLASVDAGEAAVPLLDRYADMSLLGLMTTAVTPIGVENFVEGGELSRTWHVAFTL